MYSWEIQQLLELKKYLLNSKEYLKICSTSPQIIRVSYNPYDDIFYIKTNDGYEWTFKVRREENETRVC